jgi:magnesium chelatase family protein
MRQPLEDKLVTISRAQGSLTFPANFQLVGAMNPCPCGYYGDPVKACTCSSATITRYQKRLSGPLLDRIDIHTEVPRVDFEKLSEDRLGEASELVRARVEAARQRQRARFAADAGVHQNADMRVAEVRKYCQLDEESAILMKSAMSQMDLTARAYHRILKLARTIADLAEAERIKPVHLAEALQYRARTELFA